MKPENESVAANAESVNSVSRASRIMSDLTVKAVMHQSDDSNEPVSFHSCHHPQPNGFSYTTGRAEHRLREVFVIGNEGINEEYIRQFINFGPVKRNELIGRSFKGNGGAQVSVTIKNQKELMELNGKYKRVLSGISNASTGWYVLEPIYK